MAQTQVQTEARIARIERERESSKPIAGAPKKQRKRYLSSFWRHFLEMNVAM